MALAIDFSVKNDTISTKYMVYNKNKLRFLRSYLRFACLVYRYLIVVNNQDEIVA